MSTAILPPRLTTTATRTKFSYTICPGVPTVSALAHKLGYLQEEFSEEPDLDVTIKLIGAVPRTSIPHDERFWIRHAGFTPAVWGRSHGLDTRVVALAWLESPHPIHVLASSPLQTVADLKGKRLGISRTVGAPFDLGYSLVLRLYDAALSTAGLTLDDVELVTFEQEKPAVSDPKAMFVVLQEQASRLRGHLDRGDIDALARLPVGLPTENNVRVLYDLRAHPDHAARGLTSTLRGVVVHAPLIRERRDVVVRALARLLQAGEWAKAHPEQVLPQLAEGYGFAPARLAHYENLSEGLQIDLSPERVSVIAPQKDFLLKHGIIPLDFDAAAWIDYEPLAEAQELYADWKKSGRVVVD